jgi:hypothetical protein
MKKQLANHFPVFVAVALAAMLTGCATESTVQVGSKQFFQPYQGASKQEFIGFAGGRAFEEVTLIPFAPWSIPKTIIRSCPVYELSPEQFEVLKSRIKIPKAPNAKPADQAQR